MIFFNFQENIEKLIRENSSDDDYIGPQSREVIDEIEQLLDVALPDDYRWFLSNYGHGGTFGVVILGSSKVGKPSVVRVTERYRRLGLPRSVVVIQDCDEFAYCLDTSKLENGSCPVVSWTFGGRFDSHESNSFFEFLYQSLIEAKENWD
jgi:hypothetical protein